MTIIGGCAGSDGAAPASAEDSAITPTTLVDTTESAETGTSPRTTRGDDTPSAATTQTVTKETVPEDPGVAEEFGLWPIELLTAADGGGTRPLLEWSEVEGATHYYVVVLAPNETTYWAWRTSEPSVPVGGRPLLSPDAAGPSISPGMSWSVLATGEDGVPLALSGRRPIAP